MTFRDQLELNLWAQWYSIALQAPAIEGSVKAAAAKADASLEELRLRYPNIAVGVPNAR